MMQEWTNPYNSFNSYKGLLYRKQFDGIISGNFLPPVEVNIDPCNNCNLNCIWCNAKKIINRNDKVMMTTEHLLELIDFCADWGVKAICFAGGGEPTLHPYLSIAFERCHDLGLESAIITNGLFMNEEQLENIAKYARWIGVSVDADCPGTYEKCKNVDKFDNVIDNIKKLVDLGSREVTFKYLIHPENQYGVYNACKIAKDIGVDCFHSRLISTRYLDNKEYNDCKDINSNSVEDTFDFDEINKQFDMCRKLDSDDFKVFTIRHKQDGEGNRRILFNKCRVSSLLCMFEANGTTSICIDRKGDVETMLCRHDNVENIRDIWGSHYHKKLIGDIDPKTDCSKCTMNVYHEILNAYEQDLFCKNFP
jgi:MoaA/NifB/PqqE/SkfB family radical SAM enzyme